jgi:hypothetical protein
MHGWECFYAIEKIFNIAIDAILELTQIFI